jgi:dTDP-glucose 4,6-dehydratase
MRRLLISGGAGFIGSHLCRRFISDGASVICMDNLLTGRLENIEDLFGHERFRFVKQDVTDYIHVPGPLDAVLHFASPASPVDFERLPIQILKVGALGTRSPSRTGATSIPSAFAASTTRPSASQKP